MLRIRTLKPEHRQHRKIGPLPDREYRLWVSMICEADDHGRLVADPEQLRVITWGYHPKVRTEHVVHALETLNAAGLIRLYHEGETLYAEFPSWRDHQRVDRPSPSRLPERTPENAREGSRGLANVREGSEGIGRDQDRKGSGSAPLFAALSESLTNGRVEFRIPESITASLDRAPRLGADARIRAASFWQAELRANPGVAFVAEVLIAEAWLVAHPERHYRKLSGFFHNWLARADRVEA